jgi:putative metallohydrolase (TIGR04338 family)
VGQFPWIEKSRVTVRRRKGITKAHYERATQTIAIPDQVGWAMREMVVLHELAHSVSWDGHGPQFVAANIALLESIMGPEMGRVMRMIYAHNGVREGNHKRATCA